MYIGKLIVIFQSIFKISNIILFEYQKIDVRRKSADLIFFVG